MHPCDEVLGSCRRCLDPGMRHGIHHRIVAFMADARNDGQGELGAIGCQQVGVEAGQVGGRSATPDDDHGIPRLGTSIDAVQGSDDACLHPLSLHHGREQTGIEDIAVGVIFQLVAEVTVPCRRGRRDDCHPLGEQGHLQLLVQGQHALLLQLC